MAITHRLSRKHSVGGVDIEISESVSVGAEANVDETIPSSSTNKEVAFVMDASQMKTLLITADKACTIKTNDGTTPDDTITLPAGTCLMWSATSGLANPFSADVTALFVTCTDETLLRIRAGYDPTV